MLYACSVNRLSALSRLLTVQRASVRFALERCRLFELLASIELFSFKSVCVSTSQYIVRPGEF